MQTSSYGRQSSEKQLSASEARHPPRTVYFLVHYRLLLLSLLCYIKGEHADCPLHAQIHITDPNNRRLKISHNEVIEHTQCPGHHSMNNSAWLSFAWLGIIECLGRCA